MDTPTLAELERIPKPKHTRKGWGYCGIAAISAATGISPLTIYNSIPNWPGYISSTMTIRILAKLGFRYERKCVPRERQTLWPKWERSWPSRVALGRIYWGEGKYDGSHWVCFKWHPTKSIWPFIYDNLQGENWRSVLMRVPQGKLKSLYFVINRKGASQ